MTPESESNKTIQKAFYSFMGEMPKQYRRFIEGPPTVFEVTVSGQYSWQTPRSAYDRNGGETTPESDSALVQSLRGKSYQELKKLAIAEGFNALFNIQVTETEFEEERWQQGLMVGQARVCGIRICKLTAEALAYHLNFEKGKRSKPRNYCK